MPRSVRNWNIRATVDGRKTDLSFSPKAPNGGFTMQIWQRRNGVPFCAATITGTAIGWELTLALYDVERAETLTVIPSHR